MRHKKHESSPEEISEQELSYFELQAYWGATKHGGALKGTRELIELCHIDKNKYILEVGCGVGITSCYIAKVYGCRVIGVDISEKMIKWSNERAKRDGVGNSVEFRVADAQNLPFEDDVFDVVIGESVTAFLKDKQRGVNEYVRVTKPGGYVGLNEVTWIKVPPPTELVKYYSRTTGAEPENSGGWRELLEGSGLRDLVVRTYKLDVLSDFIDRIKRLGSEDFPRALYKFVSLSISSPAFRRYMKETLPPLKITQDVLKYLGYGIYVGRKFAQASG
jgi:arsenite methyltransferase